MSDISISPAMMRHVVQTGQMSQTAIQGAGDATRSALAAGQTPTPAETMAASVAKAQGDSSAVQAAPTAGGALLDMQA